MDELYQATVIPVAVKLADFFSDLDYEWLIDPLVNLVAAVSQLISKFLDMFDKRVIDSVVDLTGLSSANLSNLGGAADLNVVDGLINGLAEITDWVGRNILRPIETGKVQNYLLVVVLSVLALLGIYLVY
jgi:NADH-quinone oxidoreductase subunit L